MLAGFRRWASARNAGAPRGRATGPTGAARETSRFSLSWMGVYFFCDVGPVVMPFHEGIYSRAKQGMALAGCIQGETGRQLGKVNEGGEGGV